MLIMFCELFIIIFSQFQFAQHHVLHRDADETFLAETETRSETFSLEIQDETEALEILSETRPRPAEAEMRPRRDPGEFETFCETHFLE